MWELKTDMANADNIQNMASANNKKTNKDHAYINK